MTFDGSPGPFLRCHCFLDPYLGAEACFLLLGERAQDNPMYRNRTSNMAAENAAKTIVITANHREFDDSTPRTTCIALSSTLKVTKTKSNGSKTGEVCVVLEAGQTKVSVAVPSGHRRLRLL